MREKDFSYCMNIQYLSPLQELRAEVKSFFSNDYLVSFFKKFCGAVRTHVSELHEAKNAKYDIEDFLRVFFYAELTGRSIESASNRLNRYFLSFWTKERKKYDNGHFERASPHQTGVNRVLQEIGLETARTLFQECVFSQLQDALRLQVISSKVNVLIDFTERPYYGKRRDKKIKGTIKQKGTRKMRHYLGFSILSRHEQFFAGLEHVAKGEAKVPFIVRFLHKLREVGFEVNFVMMDREFYNAELLHEIKKLGAEILMPAKSYNRVKGIIEDYLDGSGKRIRLYLISSAPGARSRVSQRVYLILGVKKGYSLLGVKRAFKKGKMTKRKAISLIYAIMTTQKPRGDVSSWASRLSRCYKKRWFIETGFSDLNRMAQTWKSKYDNVRYLDILARILLYNSWKLNRACLHKRRSHGGKLRKWTLKDNQDSLEDLFLETWKSEIVSIVKVSAM